ncbi:MAG: phosphopantetheine-binding protein, partial [Candidatus Thermoplasmatota archaeon]|nr:phosphopantetheine-binding protein [Candidatus Thermoplasmatota archaeon]
GKLVSYVDGDSNLHGGVKGAEWPITRAYEGITSESNGQTPPQVEPKQVDVDEAKVEIAQTTTTIAATSDISADQSNVVDTVIEVVVKHTGYPADFVELDQDLEGELGIDTVKQAEIMAEIRSVFGLPVDEDFVLADYPTLNHMIGYINQMTGSSTSVAKSVATPVAAVVDPIIEAPSQAEPPTTTSVVSPPSDSSLVETVVEVVVEHTGYP